MPMATKDKVSRKEKKRRKKLTAKTADRHHLYEQSVQAPEADVKFYDRVFRKTYDRKPSLLREDFCGTALLSCEWVKKRGDNRAIGIDLDPEVLDWGREHNLPRIGDAAERIELVEQDVMAFSGEPAEIVASMNFSYYIFKTRSVLLEYFTSVRKGLAKEGLFVMDMMGGPDAQVPQEEVREIEGFDYVWDQHSFNPITNEAMNYIHFRFPDGSEMSKAFVYDWRLWSVTELRDTLMDAGFSSVDVYWEGTDEDGEGNGVFRKSKLGDDSPAWIAYVVATP